MTPSFDIMRSLDVFLSVADAGSMTLASRRLGVTQSAISQQVRILETEFGSPLFDRQSRPMKLTPAGAMLYQRAGRLLLDVKETWTHVRQTSGVLLPHLRLAVLSTLARPMLLPLIAAAESGELPVQSLAVVRGVSRSHTQDLANRDIDLAITSDALVRQEDLDQFELLSERYLMILPEGAAKAGDDLVSIAERLPFIRYTSGIQSGQRIQRHFRRLHLDISPKYSFESPQDLVACVVAGYGWAVVTPSQLAYTLQDSTQVEARRFPGLDLERSITLIARRGELRHVAERLSIVCRRVLQQELIPRVQALLPQMHDVCTVVGAAPLPDDSPALP